MKKGMALLVLSMGVRGLAATYTVNAGSDSATIQSILNTAGNSAGNTVVFSAGAYSLTHTLTLPCSNGTVYTGPNVGVVTQANLPTAVLSSTVSTNYAFSTDSNGTSFIGAQGCMIQYLRFTGTQGGVLVYYPASGITIQENAFDNNNPPDGGNSSQSNIYLTGENWNFSAATGVSHITIVWNTFFNNCAAIRADGTSDSGGDCASTWVNAFNNYLTWSNNTVNLTEEGLKLSAQQLEAQGSQNLDVENNNMQGNSRILIEAQQDTNGVSVYSHNAFYQPFNPGFNTYELSIPEWTGSTAPTHTASDNVMIGNVPVTIGGSGAHYGIGLELWGAGSIATNNLFQGGNGPDTCAAGWGCSGWNITLGGAFSNATITGNYFSGTDVWVGSATNLSNALTYEDGASPANAGLVSTPNTVAHLSTAIPTVAPAIAISGSTVTISDSDTLRRLSIFYTTDGSTPAVFPSGGAAGTTRLYSSPFTVGPGSTVKAIASWGQGANQGIVFPSFGYVPSGVVTALAGANVGAAASTSSLPARRLVGAYLGSTGGSVTMKPGGTLQFKAYGIYSDGTAGALPDALGNKVTAWNTTNHKIAKVSTQGHATAMGSGMVGVEAMVGSTPASPWYVTVAPATVAASAPALAPTLPEETPRVSADVQPPASATPEAPASEAPPAADSPEAPLAPTPGPVAPTAGATAGPAPSGPGAALPDTFLGPFWHLMSPSGGSASISNAHLFLGVPGGANHDTLTGNNKAVRVVQAIGNQDFDVAIKIDMPLYAGDANTKQGLMVMSGNRGFLTFELETNGTKIGLGAEIVNNGSVSTVLDDPDFAQYQNPMYLRLTRAGSAYVAYYSLDGVSWTQATTFNDSSTTTAIGPFASNYNSNPASAVPVVMSVNWFDVLQ
jgi:Fn3 associated/Bacterial Ig-like domain (group 2)